MIITIRKAIVGDINSIIALCSEQFEVMANLQPYLHQKGEPNKEFIASIITDEESDIFVAEINDIIVGFVSVFERTTPEFNFKVKHKYCYIMDIIITETYRRKGLATKLITSSKEWAAERALEYIELTVLSNNSAINFYKKEQFEETAQTMICRL